MATEWSQIKTKLRLDDLAPVLKLRPSWNIPPTRDIIAVRSIDGRRRAAHVRWGLIPHWARDVRIGSTFNARADTVTEEPTFRDAWRAGLRCLVVADGFYEWRKSDKQPFAIGMADCGLMTFAGLWETWQSPDGETLYSTAIITTGANDTMAPVHHRMPVVIPEARWPAWLGEAQASEPKLLAMLAPSDPTLIRTWPVDRRIGNVRNDDAGLARPMAELSKRLL
jgi:putative SOS response-associated peptidase YedK